MYEAGVVAFCSRTAVGSRDDAFTTSSNTRVRVLVLMFTLNETIVGGVTSGKKSPAGNMTVSMGLLTKARSLMAPRERVMKVLLMLVAKSESSLMAFKSCCAAVRFSGRIFEFSPIGKAEAKE